MSVIFDEVIGEIEPPMTAEETDQAGSQQESRPLLEDLRDTMRRLRERQARLQAD